MNEDFKKIIGEHQERDGYWYLLKMKYSDRTILKVGHTFADPTERFKGISTSFDVPLKNLSIIVIAKIKYAHLIEKEFHKNNKKKKLSDVNSSLFGKSKECYPYDKKMLNIVSKFIDKNKSDFKDCYFDSEFNIIKDCNEVKKLIKTTLTPSEKWNKENILPEKRISKKVQYYGY